MTELEKKLLLTEEEYTYLLSLCGQKKPTVRQTNYYFDTDDLLMNRKNITCRIRFKNGNCKGTMKQHTANTDHSTEIEMDIRNGINDNAFIDMGLKLQGELITERCYILQKPDCEIVLDKNEYLGHTDYELEIEYLPEYKKDAQAIYRVILDMLRHRKCNIAYNGNPQIQKAPSKSNRFFERMSKHEFNT